MSPCIHRFARWSRLALVGSLLPSYRVRPDTGRKLGDTAWLLTATTLVLFMTLPGLAAFYSGLVRTKNVLSVLMQCFAISCVVSVLWLLGGYGLALRRRRQPAGVHRLGEQGVVLRASGGTPSLAPCPNRPS